jgi:hypothetical protein
MEARKLEKDLIFYAPGRAGSIFTYQKGFLVTSEIIDNTIDHLKYETESHHIEWVEDRRRVPRI